MEAKLFYKNLKIYQASKAVVKDVYQLMKKFPPEERFALCQLDISADLGYITQEELKHVEDESVELIRMMKGMMRNLSSEKS